MGNFAAALAGVAEARRPGRRVGSAGQEPLGAHAKPRRFSGHARLPGWQRRRSKDGPALSRLRQLSPAAGGPGIMSGRGPGRCLGMGDGGWGKGEALGN